MNTGIGDAVDLGWKLAAVQQGWGGEGLLASYDAERRPVGLRNVKLTAEFYGEHEKFGEELATIAPSAIANCLRRQTGAA
jgi:2-polyprenyl-6-methoxyphenol hydroxylase-like FAD-dependent oxidoreductase